MTVKGYDAVVVGAGPNGLAAALRLAEAGATVRVYEGADTIGGGTRTAELTLPGFRHDVCSTVHPLALASPYLRRDAFLDAGLRWIHPPLALAHPFDDGSAVVLARSPEETARHLGSDSHAYQRLVGPLLAQGPGLIDDLLAPLRWPENPRAVARFGLLGLGSARSFSRRFRGVHARGLIAGLASHSMLPLEAPLTGAIALVLGLLAHQVGWPFAAGGSQRISEAMAGMLERAAGQIKTGTWVKRFDDLPDAGIYLLDQTPRQVLTLAGERFTARYRRQLVRYRYGPGVFKIDYALDAAIPWTADACHRAGTIHLGATFEEIAEAERVVAKGRHSERPFVLLTQPTLFDPDRAPAGKHIAWAYCHVPSGSSKDMTQAIEAQIERFAPGFQQRVLARHTMTATDMQAYNPNYIDGDINGGVQDWRQHFTRPSLRRDPYTTSDPRIYICSSATPPGGGVHGMCGYHAAEATLKRLWT